MKHTDKLIGSVTGAVPSGNHGHLEIPGHHGAVTHIKERYKQSDVAELAMQCIGIGSGSQILVFQEYRK